MSTPAQKACEAFSIPSGDHIRAVEYRSQLAAAGLSVIGEYEDQGEHHRFEALKGAPTDSSRE